MTGDEEKEKKPTVKQKIKEEAKLKREEKAKLKREKKAIFYKVEKWPPGKLRHYGTI